MRCATSGKKRTRPLGIAAAGDRNTMLAAINTEDSRLKSDMDTRFLIVIVFSTYLYVYIYIYIYCMYISVHIYIH